MPIGVRFVDVAPWEFIFFGLDPKLFEEEIIKRNSLEFLAFFIEAFQQIALAFSKIARFNGQD